MFRIDVRKREERARSEWKNGRIGGHGQREVSANSGYRTGGWRIILEYGSVPACDPIAVVARRRVGRHRGNGDPVRPSVGRRPTGRGLRIARRRRRRSGAPSPRVYAPVSGVGGEGLPTRPKQPLVLRSRFHRLRAPVRRLRLCYRVRSLAPAFGQRARERDLGPVAPRRRRLWDAKTPLKRARASAL